MRDDVPLAGKNSIKCQLEDRVFLSKGVYIFLLRAVTSRDALTMRSLRSWCSSSSLRNSMNMGVKRDSAIAGPGLPPSLGRVLPSRSLLDMSTILRRSGSLILMVP